MVEESIIGKGEAEVLLSMIKFPEEDHTATALSKRTGYSIMGVFKILKGLERKRIVSSKKIGRASLYKIETGNNKVIALMIFLLKRSSEQQSAYLLSWAEQLKRISSADIVILFGSVLKKEKDARDVDILLVTTTKNFSSTKKEVEELNMVNVKRIHPLYQTIQDLKKNIRKKDPVILQSIKGIVLLGEEKYIKVTAG